MTCTSRSCQPLPSRITEIAADPIVVEHRFFDSGFPMVTLYRGAVLTRNDAVVPLEYCKEIFCPDRFSWSDLTLLALSRYMLAYCGASCCQTTQVTSSGRTPPNLPCNAAKLILAPSCRKQGLLWNVSTYNSRAERNRDRDTIKRTATRVPEKDTVILHSTPSEHTSHCNGFCVIVPCLFKGFLA